MEQAVKFYSIKQLVEITGLHRTTISRMLSQKKIPYVRIGKRALIDSQFVNDLQRRAQESVNIVAGA
jgi:excisionase family DNA binding protein